MNKLQAAVFDMDGTLYQFPEGATFSESPLGVAVRQNTADFLSREFKLSDEAAWNRYDELLRRYDGEMSLGLEREFGINRMRFFDETWDIDPENIIVPEPGLREQMERLDIQCALLTAAPRVWAKRAIGYIGIANLFGDNIITGEPDIRKPNPEVFRQIMNKVGSMASQTVSIGDQDFSDIVPAKQLGMRTVRIGQDENSVADLQARNVNDALVKLRQKGWL
ncbi:MAG TPA: HAD-IA family hydrolase [Candidatus Nanoperiomorbaceae bacterium]|nr:HAD-IA family hydrolase [Candidatus Nanoperiomorbaceae bacterium]HMR86432.1 HAD-IA family hydrolase [Candidatus Nanoperiomorbaceae bacterium]